jgi:hypothetical protein
MRRAILNVAVVAITTTLVLVLATSVTAETILIRSGTASYDTGDPATLSLTGEEFALNSLFLSFAGPIPCFSGCVTSVSPGTLFGPLGEGGAVVGDTRYGRDDLGPGPGDVAFKGRLLFDAGTLPIPESDDPFLRITTPFALTGHIAAFPNLTATIPLFEVDVFGSGVATLLLDRGPSGVYFFTAADYTIQDPVPEPATLLLFGSGITALVIRCRRTRDDRA